MDKPTVYLGMPHYGDVNLGAARALLVTPTAGAVDVRWNADASTSLTPHTFNGLLAMALDARDRGEVTHFAMLHSDIVPQDHWLDVLWDEMASHRADLVSAVVPIKDPDGTRTSTAIGAKGDPWRPLRYVETTQRESLPSTFGPEHVCSPDEVLLLNTGCWLADLRRPWWDNFAFEFRCRISRDNGRRVAQVQPEDWQMSRHLQARGAVVRATWRVRLAHHGAGEWRNP